MKFTTTTLKALATQVSPIDHKECPNGNNKVSIVGAGTIGTAIAFTLLAQKVCGELVLIDKSSSLAAGEVLDIEHAALYLETPRIVSSTDYGASQNSKICIVTAGARGNESSKEKLFNQNVEIFKDIIPKVVAQSPECILVICSCPVDEMSYVAWKLSGLPSHRIIGTGTLVDSAKFRQLISKKIDVHPNSCQAYIIGESGSNSLPAWSSVNVAGVRLRDLNPDMGMPSDPEDWGDIHEEVLASSSKIEGIKECASWALAVAVARIVDVILQDKQEVLPVSTHIRGCRHGVEKDVYMSLPCALGCTGVQSIIKQHLCPKEKEQLQKSADRMHALQKSFVDTNKKEEDDCEEIERKYNEEQAQKGDAQEQMS